MANQKTFDDFSRVMRDLDNAALLKAFEAAVNDAARFEERHDDAAAEESRYKMHAARRVLEYRLGIRLM